MTFEEAIELWRRRKTMKINKELQLTLSDRFFIFQYGKRRNWTTQRLNEIENKIFTMRKLYRPGLAPEEKENPCQALRRKRKENKMSTLVKLHPCLFCGHKAEFCARQPKGTMSSGMEPKEYRIQCSNPDCPVRPHTKSISIEEFFVGKGYISVEYRILLADLWNTRANS